MIAPIAKRPPAPRQHAVEIREKEQRIANRLSRTVEKYPIVAIGSAMFIGVALGWLVKRKQG